MASYTKIFSTDIGDSYRINNGRTVYIDSMSGSVGDTIKSASVTLGVSCTSGAGYTTYSVSVTVGGVATGSGSFVIPSGSSTGYNVTIKLSNISGVNWSASSLDLTVRCTGTSGGQGTTSTIYIKGVQKITVNSSTTESGGGDSGGSGGSSEGSTVSTSPISLSTTSATVGTRVTCMINPTNSSSYHKITWLINNNTVKGPTTLSAGTTSSYIDISSSHMSLIPNDVSGVLTCNVQTYNSAGLVGYSAANCTISVPSSYVPTFTFEAENFTPTDTRNGKCYTNVSKPGVTINDIAPGTGASISRFNISCTGLGSISDNAISNSLVYTFEDRVNIAGTSTISVTIIDSRGRSTTKSYSFFVESYSPPTARSFDTYRCNENGDGTGNGTYLRVILSDASVGNILDTDMLLTTIQIKTKVTSDVNYTLMRTIDVNEGVKSIDVIIPGYDIDYNYDIQVSIADILGTVTNLYDRIFKYGGVLFDICGVENNESIGIGEGVTGKGVPIPGTDSIQLYDKKLVINGQWDIIYKGGDIADYFLKMSDVVGGTNYTNDTKVRKIYYGDTEPLDAEEGTLWVKPV